LEEPGRIADLKEGLKLLTEQAEQIQDPDLLHGLYILVYYLHRAQDVLSALERKSNDRPRAESYGPS
jgi:hypothetical protein